MAVVVVRVNQRGTILQSVASPTRPNIANIASHEWFVRSRQQLPRTAKVWLATMRHYKSVTFDLDALPNTLRIHYPLQKKTPKTSGSEYNLTENTSLIDTTTQNNVSFFLTVSAANVPRNDDAAELAGRVWRTMGHAMKRTNQIYLDRMCLDMAFLVKSKLAQLLYGQ